MNSKSDDNSTSPSLILRVQQSDQDAWQQLTHLYGPLVFHWCQRMGLRGDDLADLFQEVFLSVSRSINRFQPRGGGTDARGSFRGWLWTITKNKVLDHQRSQSGKVIAQGGTAAHQMLSDFEDPFTDDSVDSSDRSATVSLLRRGMDMIQAEFEPRTWEAFWRAVVDQHSTAMIADDLQISQASVRQAKSRVLRRLREVLGDQ